MLRLARVAALALAAGCGAAGGQSSAADRAVTRVPAVATPAVVVSHGTPPARAVPWGNTLGYSIGRAGAPVVVVEFSDMACGYCASFAATVRPVLERELVAPGDVEWRIIPIATASTPHAREAAAAVACAARQGAAPAMHDHLLARRREWARLGNPAPSFTAYARALGLDAAQFAGCLTSAETATAVERFWQLGRQMGVRLAPTFFVNGRRVEGALELGEFRAVVREARGRG